MKSYSIDVKPLRLADAARWDWDTGAPSFYTGWRSVTVDPFPAYPHDVAVINAVAAKVAVRFAPGYDVTIYLADREATSRSNAHAERLKKWDGKEYTETAGVIFVSGKRIPPHPAVTRYLVAHEYGHHVEWWLEKLRGLEEDKLIQEYLALRELDTQVGGGGVWHKAAQEVFACDFRVLVADVEPEYWPHAGVLRPGEVPAIREWWSQAVAEWTARAAAPTETEA